MDDKTIQRKLNQLTKIVNELADEARVNIVPVKAGTIVRNGERILTVTEDSGVAKGRTIYMTERNYKILRAHPDVVSMETRK
jgi:hypothetical protein